MQSHSPDHQIAHEVEPTDQKLEAVNGCSSFESLEGRVRPEYRRLLTAT